jgi:hypothetical protein
MREVVMVNPDDRNFELSRRLFNDLPETTSPDDVSKMYDATLLEQYKLYVEMAERISVRRGLANSFFLTLNTGVVTTFTAFYKVPAGTEALWLSIPLIALVGGCFAWYYLVRSYRLLNGVKYRVVAAFEQRLPAAPFGRAEWLELGEGHDRRRYWPLTHIELWIPFLFALTYISAIVGAVLR